MANIVIVELPNLIQSDVGGWIIPLLLPIAAHNSHKPPIASVKVN